MAALVVFWARMFKFAALKSEYVMHPGCKNRANELMLSKEIVFLSLDVKTQILKSCLF